MRLIQLPAAPGLSLSRIHDNIHRFAHMHSTIIGYLPVAKSTVNSLHFTRIPVLHFYTYNTPGWRRRSKFLRPGNHAEVEACQDCRYLFRSTLRGKLVRPHFFYRATHMQYGLAVVQRLQRWTCERKVAGSTPRPFRFRVLVTTFGKFFGYQAVQVTGQ